MINSPFNSPVINQIIKMNIEQSLSGLVGSLYSYAVMNKRNPAEYYSVSNYPDAWSTIYIENNYQFIDPVVTMALNSVLPFQWDEKIITSCNLKLTKIFNIAKKHNIIGGHTFVLHDADKNLALLSLLINTPDVEVNINNNINELQMLLIKTHDRLLKTNKEIKKLTQGYTTNKKELTLKENEVLHWASIGKTYQEIACIMHIKAGTVKFHMGNIVKKLDALNAKHAISLAAELTLLKPLSN